MSALHSLHTLALSVVFGGALLAAAGASAGEADVVDAKVRRSAPGVYDFDVTVSSADRGWAYYADAFEVLAPDGTLLGRRVLLRIRTKPSSCSRANCTA